jgi:hypothetical protein
MNKQNYVQIILLPSWKATCPKKSSAISDGELMRLLYLTRMFGRNLPLLSILKEFYQVKHIVFIKRLSLYKTKT